MPRRVGRATCPLRRQAPHHHPDDPAHEAVVLGDNRNAPERLRHDQRYHQDQKGWIDIAYHIGVDRNGNLYELRNTAIAGDTATDYDTTGHFLVSAKETSIKRSCRRPNCMEPQSHSPGPPKTLASRPTRCGPSDLAQTSCPGANLYAHIASGDLKRRIDDLLSAAGWTCSAFADPRLPQESRLSRRAIDQRLVALPGIEPDALPCINTLGPHAERRRIRRENLIARVRHQPMRTHSSAPTPGRAHELLEQTQDFALDPDHDPQWVDSLLVRRHEQLYLHATRP